MIDVAGNIRRRKAEKEELKASRSLNKGLVALLEEWKEASVYFESLSKVPACDYEKKACKNKAEIFEKCAKDLKSLIEKSN